jgi:hypothetical protein
MSNMAAANLTSLNGGVFLQVRDELTGVSDHLNMTAHNATNKTKPSNATKAATSKNMTKIMSTI